MKHHSFSHALFAVTALAAMLLNSCYFNSAGHIFDKAGHKSVADLADLTTGSTIYVKDSRYYIELPRYRYDKPVRTQYSAFEQDVLEKKRVKTSDTVMMTIPADYALYLAGLGPAPVISPFMRKYDGDPQEIKNSADELVVVYPTKSVETRFNYKSSAPAVWYTLGALDWLCVDLPITCVENSLAALVIVGAVANAYEEAEAERYNNYNYTE